MPNFKLFKKKNPKILNGSPNMIKEELEIPSHHKTTKSMKRKTITHLKFTPSNKEGDSLFQPKSPLNNVLRISKPVLGNYVKAS